MTDNLQSHLQQPVELPPSSDLPHVPLAYKQRRQRSKKIVIAILVILLLAAAGAGGWFLLKKRKEQADQKQKAAQSQTAEQNAQATSSKNDIPEDSDLKTYKNTGLGLEISHPSAWKVTEATPEVGGITLTSPELTYQTTDKGEVRGNFRVYIRKGAREIDGKYIGAGVATQPSEKLVYTAPGNTQRKDTNFTQFGALTSDNFTFFMVTGDYQLAKDETLGPTYGREAETYILVGGFGSKDQKDDMAFSSIPLGKYQSTRAYTQAVNIIKSLKLR